VEDKALIFKKSDVEDLREKLQDACDHPEMVMKMKNQAADFICEKYNWDGVLFTKEFINQTIEYSHKKGYKLICLACNDDKYDWCDVLIQQSEYLLVRKKFSKNRYLKALRNIVYDGC